MLHCELKWEMSGRMLNIGGIQARSFYRRIGTLPDAIGLELGDGAAEIQKIVISRELLGKEFLPY